MPHRVDYSPFLASMTMEVSNAEKALISLLASRAMASDRAFALKAYGYVRATQDVDFLGRAADQDKIVCYLESSMGYETIYRCSVYLDLTSGKYESISKSMARWRDTMKSSEKAAEHEDLDLEKDLPLTLEDIVHMGKTRIQNSQDLGAYLDFLEQINAFEARSGKRRFYDSDFEL